MSSKQHNMVSSAKDDSNSIWEEYTNLGEIGNGGFAQVFKVRHNEFGYFRAIRKLKAYIKDKDSDIYQKFIRECKVLLRLGNGNHRNIVHIYQPRLMQHEAFVEMDYVDGMNLSQYLEESGNYLPLDEVLHMVSEISSALSYSHEDIYSFCIDPDEDQLERDPYDGTKWVIDENTKKRLIDKYKVIHNDIHSRNIMRRVDGSFVLLDFGLAIEGEDVVKSGSRHDNGVPEYMAPEKWNNESILSEQSDIYSFGVVMYEYLAGRVPFVCEGNSFNAKIKLYDTLNNNSKPPAIYDLRKAYFERKYPDVEYKKDYPDWLENAILKCLAINPEKRFRNGRELHDYIVQHITEDSSANEKDIEVLRSSNFALNDKVNKLETELNALKSAPPKIIVKHEDSKELIEAKAEIKRVQKSLSEAADSLIIKDKEIESLKKSNETLQKGQDTTRKTRAVIPLVILSCLLACGLGLGVAKYVNDTNNMRNVISKLEEQYTTSTNSATSNEAEMNEQITSLKESIATKDKIIAENTEQINLLKQQLNAKTENGYEISKLEKELEGARKKNIELNNKNERLNNENQALKIERDALNKQMNKRSN